MKKFNIAQYKTYTLDYIVYADSENDALYLHAMGKSRPDLDSLMFLEEPVDIGMGKEELKEPENLTEDQEEKILDKKADFLPGIHSIEEIEEC